MSRPPAARVDPVVETIHGVRVSDPYRWLEDGEAPAVRRWVAAQNAYARSVLTAGEEDSRVDPMHARKMAARLQAADPETPVLLRAEPRAGHGQGKPASKILPEEADVWAFLLHSLS